LIDLVCFGLFWFVLAWFGWFGLIVSFCFALVLVLGYGVFSYDLLCDLNSASHSFSPILSTSKACLWITYARKCI
jgi:hypothetical protein